MNLRELITRQELVLSRAQALTRGVSPEQWEWRMTSGRWTRLTPGIAVAHTGELTGLQRAWAAYLHAGTGAVLSGDAALEVLGLTAITVKHLDVVVPHARRLGKAPTLGKVPLRVHRSRGLDQLARAPHPLPLLSAHVAALHAASWAADDRNAEWRLAAVVQQKLSAPVLMREALLALPQLRRRALIAEVLDDVELGAHAGSELRFLRFLRRHGLPAPDELQVKVRITGRTYFLDARWARARLTVEVDGAHHRDVGQWDADALRSLRLVSALAGEQVVRITTGNLRHDEEEVARCLRLLLV